MVIDTGMEARKYILNLTKPGEEYKEVKTGVIQKKCLASWSDNPLVHSSELVVDWDYQAWKTTLKRLDHCIELTVIGPIEIQGIAKGYVDYCINYGIHHQKTRHLLELLVAIGGDIASAGATGSALTQAKIANYVTSAANEITDCLTNTDKLSAYVADSLKEKFNGSVRHESHWVYWNP